MKKDPHNLLIGDHRRQTAEDVLNALRWIIRNMDTAQVDLSEVTFRTNPIDDLNLDSLTVAEITQRILDLFEVEIGIEEIYEAPNMERIVDAIMVELYKLDSYHLICVYDQIYSPELTT